MTFQKPFTQHLASPTFEYHMLLLCLYPIFSPGGKGSPVLLCHFFIIIILPLMPPVTGTSETGIVSVKVLFIRTCYACDRMQSNP